MKTILRRIGMALAIALLAFVVLRALVVPLAMQRQERRDQDPTGLALVPADARQWCLQRNNLRRMPSVLWPRARETFRERCVAWDLPMELLATELGLKSRSSGEWVVALGSGDTWLLAGPLTRLHRDGEVARSLAAAPDTTLDLSEGIRVEAWGRWFLASRGAWDEARWLSGESEWLDLQDLLMAGDWLEFRAREEGGALLSLRSMAGHLLAEGLAWDCGRGAELLSELCPGPAIGAAVTAEALDSVPLLRRSGPFDRKGRALPPVASHELGSGTLVGGERRWGDGSTAALARVLGPR